MDETTPHSQTSKQNYLIPLAIFAGAIVIAGAVYFSPSATAPSQPVMVQGGNGETIIDPASVVLDLEGFPSLGSVDAPVLMVEFSDFACPFCKRFVDDTKELILKDYVDKGLVRFVRKDFITVGGTAGAKAAEAAHCAGDQGKYWEYQQALLSRQTEDRANWTDIQIHTGYARSIGLNATTFLECLNSTKYADKVITSTNEAASFGARGTPHFFINGIPVSGAQPYGVFKQLIDAELAKS
jgi:protein-disulfide isomerase